MEARNSTILESSGEDSTLFETVKSIVKREGRRETESEEDFFLESQEQEKQYSGASVEEATLQNKHQIQKIVQWTDLCRICANANDHLIPIFEGEGAELDLSSKILKYLPIHVCITVVTLCFIQALNILVNVHCLSIGI